MKINLQVFIFCVIAVIASFNDIFIYVFSLDYGIKSIVISVFLALIISIILIKKKCIRIKSDFDIFDFIFLIPFIILSVIFMRKADFSYDTSNYHIYLQENCFIDKINFDFFAGRTINSFLFPLGDRMHYLFRYFLGYRLGVILSFYTIIVLYYQTKNIIKTYKKEISSVSLFLLSVIPTCLYFVNEFSGTYYIDNFSFVILLEMISIFLRKINILKEKQYLFYISLLIGISTGIKLPNLILAAVIFIMIIITNCLEKNKITDLFKLINFKDIIICLILFLFPFIIYGIDNFVQTGSAIYPYYNTIFKSEYFNNINWNDENFGIPNVLYSVIWPIVVCLNPVLGNNNAGHDAIFGIGYIIGIISIIIKLKNKDYDEIFKLSVLGTILSIVWAIFLMGYVRYAIILPILYTILIEFILIKIDIMKKIKEEKLLHIVIAMCLISICTNVYCKIIYDSIIRVKYALNETEAEFGYDNDIYEIEGVWGTIGDNSAFATLIRNPNTPIYNLDTWHLLFSDKAKELYYEKIKDKKIYVISEFEFETFEIILKERGFKIIEEVGIYENKKLKNIEYDWHIYKVEYEK